MSYQKLFNNYFSTYDNQTGGARNKNKKKGSRGPNVPVGPRGSQSTAQTRTAQPQTRTVQKSYTAPSGNRGQPGPPGQPGPGTSAPNTLIAPSAAPSLTPEQQQANFTQMMSQQFPSQNAPTNATPSIPDQSQWPGLMGSPGKTAFSFKAYQADREKLKTVKQMDDNWATSQGLGPVDQQNVTAYKTKQASTVTAAQNPIAVPPTGR